MRKKITAAILYFTSGNFYQLSFTINIYHQGYISKNQSQVVLLFFTYMLSD
jgi:hypothetical protein